MTAMHETPDDENVDSGNDNANDNDNDAGESLDNLATQAPDAPAQPATIGPAGRSANIGHT